MKENQRKTIKINKPAFMLRIAVLSYLLLLCSITQAQVFYTESSPNQVKSMRGGATWVNNSGDFVYNSNGRHYLNRALLYSTSSYQSEDGFVLTVEYTAASINASAAHKFSFGLISDDTNLSNYSGINPFGEEQSVYSIGANLTATGGSSSRGMNFANGSESTTLDQSGTRAEFETGVTTKVTIEIGIGGYWVYRINDVYEASGVILEGIDLSKNYHVAVYAQDDNGGEKSIQSITLEKNYAAGERAEKLRGTWSTGIKIELMDALIDADLKTVDDIGISFTDGASLSAQHYAPHKLLESFSAGEGEVPLWGNLNLDEPQNDPFLENILSASDAGFKIKAYTNCEGFAGNNQPHLETFVQNFKKWCDTATVAQDFLKSQPFYTHAWNRNTGKYDDASFPNRKYISCYAEFVLKDYSIRYGEHFESWIFDAGNTMTINGDNATSGLIEEQRLYQAYANAVHAGNPEIPIAFNNGRSTLNYNSFPFAHAVRFDDFTFGHAFGGNNDHASKTGTQFVNNYKHITRMTATNGYVHDGGDWTWDDKIVGNFHSKLSTTAWKFGPQQAWEQDDFNQWNLEALQAGGHMTWDGSYNRGETFVHEWVIPLLKGMDDYLYANGVSVNDGVEPPPTLGTLVHITKRNATDFAIDGGNGAFDGQDVYLWSANQNNGNQQWLEIDRGNGYYSYQKQGTNHCIDGGAAGVNGQNVYLWPCDDNNQNQHWQKVDVGGGAFKLIKRNATGFAINGGAGGANAQSIGLWNSSSSSQNLHWVISAINSTSKSSSAKLIDTVESESLVLYPNPAKDNISLSKAVYSARIMDITGKVVKTYTTEIKNIDVSNLESGIYIFNGISTEGEPLTRKFIKE